MDSTEPPRIVLEHPEVCANADRVEGELQALLERTRAPNAEWSLGVTLERLNPQETRASAGISDGQAEVARRVLWTPGDDCEGLARAVGVWAALVFEAEVARAENGAETPTDRPDNAPTEEAAPAAPPPAAVAPTQPPVSVPVGGAMPAEERPAGLRRAATPALEVSGGAFTMFGMVDAVVDGFALDATLAAYDSVFVRPAFFIGEQAGSGPGTAMTVVRLDVCTRFAAPPVDPAIEVEPCFGIETGALHTAPSALPHGALGPSLDLRHPLGRVVSVVARATGGANFAKNSDFSNRKEAPFSGRVELALSFGVW